MRHLKTGNTLFFYKNGGLLWFFFNVLPVFGETSLFSEGSPIHINADQMEYNMIDGTATAKGHAVAQQGDYRLDASLFVVKLGENKSASSKKEGLQKIQAFGDVHLSSLKEEIFGESAVYEMEKEILTVFGHPVTLISEKGRLSAQDRISYNIQKKKAVAFGDVHITGEGNEMIAPKVTAYFESPSAQKETLNLHRVYAEGGVFIKSQGFVAQSEEANYFVETGDVNLTGNVKISDGENIFEGPCGSYNQKTKKSQLVPCSSAQSIGKKGRVKALLYQKRKAD